MHQTILNRMQNSLKLVLLWPNKHRLIFASKQRDSINLALLTEVNILQREREREENYFEKWVRTI